MKRPKLYHIRIQRWHEGYKEIAVWPKVFKTYKEAEAFMHQCFTFRNLGKRKMSACIERCK